MITTLHTPPPCHARSRTTRLCTHSRIIDDVLTPKGLKTGQVRCIECGAVFDDPVPKQGEQSRELSRTLGRERLPSPQEGDLP